jgi:hypothetical protein
MRFSQPDAQGADGDPSGLQPFWEKGPFGSAGDAL